MPLSAETEKWLRTSYKLSSDQTLDVALRRACALYEKPLSPIILDDLQVIHDLCLYVGPDGMLKTSSQKKNALRYAIENLMDDIRINTIAPRSKPWAGAPESGICADFTKKLKLIELIALHTPAEGFDFEWLNHYKRNPNFASMSSISDGINNGTIPHLELCRQAVWLIFQAPELTKDKHVSPEIIRQLPIPILLFRTEFNGDLRELFDAHIGTFAAEIYQSCFLQPSCTIIELDKVRATRDEWVDLNTRHGTNMLFTMSMPFGGDNALKPSQAAIETRLNDIYDFREVARPQCANFLITQLFSTLANNIKVKHKHFGGMIVTDPSNYSAFVRASEARGVKFTIAALTRNKDAEYSKEVADLFAACGDRVIEWTPKADRPAGHIIPLPNGLFNKHEQTATPPAPGSTATASKAKQAAPSPSAG